MPRLREPPAIKSKQNVTANIAYFMTIKKVSKETLTKAIGVSVSTFTRRKKDAGKFTLEELISIAQALRVPLIELFKERS